MGDFALERNHDIGVEIALSPRSDEDLENRYKESWTDSSIHPSAQERQSLWSFFNNLWPRSDGTPRKRSVGRQMMYGLLVFCIVAVIIAASLGVRGRNNGTEKASSSLETNDNEPLTPAPQAAVSQSPTNAPQEVLTPAPTSFLTTVVHTVKSRFAWGENITVSFSFGQDFVADTQDWIGIYPTSADPSNLGNSEAFLFLCNQQTLCDSAVSVGQVIFSADSASQEARLASWSWPLEPGEYRAYILRGFQAPFEVISQDVTSFEVMKDLFMHTVVPTVGQIQSDIRDLILEDEALGAKFVRLGFHDCTGGCDGCVDLTFGDNAGLDIPIDALAAIVQRYENDILGISRADIWVMAALLGADVAQERSDTKVDFSLQYIGRKNCEDLYDECFDQDGNIRACSATLGPHVHLPEPHITTSEIFHFFRDEFGFNMRQTVALMGAHTIGTLTREHSGFDGPNGWVRDHFLLDNDYYHELVGGSEGDGMDQLVDLAPPWLRFLIDNSDLPGIPDRPAWRAFPPALDGSGETVEILMLNADVSQLRGETLMG